MNQCLSALSVGVCHLLANRTLQDAHNVEVSVWNCHLLLLVPFHGGILDLHYNPWNVQDNWLKLVIRQEFPAY